MTDKQNTLTGYIHSVETAGTVDGPGVRYVVFLSGCPLRCQYCHNPDMMKMKRGTVKTVDEVWDDIAPYASFLKRAKGGVTVSGGEPLAQPEFTHEILKHCKRQGLHTALDTSGFLGEKASDALLENVDLVLLDIKSGIPETYMQATGVSLVPTLNFALRLERLNKPMWIRFVLVPGLTDDPDNIERLAEFVKTMKSVQRVDILPFHKMGEYKWKDLGMDYKLKDTAEPTLEQIEKARAIFAKHGIETL